MSGKNPTRTRVRFRGREVPNLYSRTKADGTVVYEHLGRINGSKLKRTILDAANASEAVAALEELRSGVRSKRVNITADRRTRVSEAVPQYKAFLASLAGTDGEKSERTLEDIYAKLEGYVVPALGHMRTVEVTPEDVRDLAVRSKRKSRSTVLAILSVTSGFFRWCAAANLSNQNPVAAAREKYARQMLPRRTEREQRSLTADEISRGMEFVGSVFSPVLTLMIESGIRTSEALGVTWEKLDLDAETLTIDAQLAADGRLAPTKTKRVRTVPISEHAAAVLRAHRDTQDANGYDVTKGFAFATRGNRPHSRRNLYRCWTAALAKAGIEDAHLHSIRHSFISGHAERGTPVVKVSALVGHSDVQVTQRVYTRVAGTESARIEALREALV